MIWRQCIRRWLLILTVLTLIERASTATSTEASDTILMEQNTSTATETASTAASTEASDTMMMGQDTSTATETISTAPPNASSDTSTMVQGISTAIETTSTAPFTEASDTIMMEQGTSTATETASTAASTEASDTIMMGQDTSTAIETTSTAPFTEASDTIMMGQDTSTAIETTSTAPFTEASDTIMMEQGTSTATETASTAASTEASDTIMMGQDTSTAIETTSTAPLTVASDTTTTESTNTATSGVTNTTTIGTTNTTTSGATSTTTSTERTTAVTESSSRTTSLSSEALFDFGYKSNINDRGFTGDDSLRYVYVPRGFPTDDTTEKYLYISTNGYIVFGQYYNSYYPNKFPYNRPRYYYRYYNRDLKIVAPFWTDSTTYNYNSRYYYDFFYHYYYYSSSDSRVFYQDYTNGKTRYGEDVSDLFNRVNQLISEKKNVEQFTARWILKITWYKMLPYNREEENTFQCILATDYHRSFALFLYGDGLMSWKQNNFYFTPGIGYQMGSKMYYNSPYSRMLSAMRIDQHKGNTGKKGLWVFRLDSNQGVQKPSLQCLSWYEGQTDADYSHIQALDRRLSDCPCTISQAFRDPRFRYYWRDSGYWYGYTCFYVTLSPRGYTGSRKCCYKRQRVWYYYRYFGWYWRSFYSLSTDEVDGGGLVMNNPLSFRQYRQFIHSDKVPHENCCVKSGLCSYYRQYRWLSTCSRYVQVRRARFWGDPHITTLDGKGYTFNGWGEYVLLNVRNSTTGDLQLAIQGRTERVLNEAGEHTDATIFTAFAAKDFETNATMQAVLIRNKTGMAVSCNGDDYTLKFNNLSLRFDVLDDNLSADRPDNKTLRVTFLSGISLNVSVGVELLEVAVSVPETLANSVATDGLLGVFNNDQADDFSLPNGTVLSINSTEEQIFLYFGQPWMVGASTTVFSYRSGDGASNHSHPEFTPKFLTDYPQDRVESAKEICGGDNKECIFDYLSTNRSDIAASTNTTAQNDAQENAAINNNIPKVTLQQTIQAVVGVWININVTAEDADNENLTIFLLNNITGFSNITQTGNSAILRWKPDSLDPVTISLSATDPSGAEAPLNSTRVLLCNGCSGNGDCDFNDTEASFEATSSNTTLFTIVQCLCYTGWEGDDCSEDIDGCADDPCAAGVNCTDLTPDQQQSQNGTAYNCSSCPPGTEEVAGKCSDIDECNSTVSVCDQNCFNTDGSYSCSCMTGYTLQDVRNCIDNDECRLATHNCTHTCSNTDGGFDCSCLPGYISQDGGVSCETDPNDNPCAGSNLQCHHGCTAVDNQPTCFCLSGYQLSNNRDCIDIDECLLTICGQMCRNTVGGYSCSCRTGYQLNSDQLNCDKCDAFHWGLNCANDCDCNENALECSNIRGCVCKSGWTGDDCDTDINECNTTECPYLQTCNNLPGGYECVCLSGYMNVSGQCQDIDECLDDALHDCDYECVNGLGSYLCRCSAGYTGDGYNCTDVNECEAQVPACEQKCVNLMGDYSCDCYRGFVLNDDRRSCVDVDGLCDNVAVKCDHICTVNDTTLDIECKCRPGYELINSTACQDIDECSNSVCDAGCANSAGSYQCTCNVGYQLSNDFKTCLECDRYHWGVDCASECKCGLGGSCNNTQGCVCDGGWTGQHCENDVLECADPAKCAQDRLCVELLGSYRCDCPAGYEKNISQCQDVDECAGQNNECSQLCSNTEGSYTCRCEPGYRDVLGNGRDCQDINECVVGHQCEARCVNTEGEYTCECYSGFSLSNKTTCTKVSEELCGSSELNCSYACNVSSGECVCQNEHELQLDQISCVYVRRRVKAKIVLNLNYSIVLGQRQQVAYDIQNALLSSYANVDDLSSVIIVDLMEGSVIAVHEVVFTVAVSFDQTQAVVSSLSAAFIAGTLTVGGIPYNITSAPVIFNSENVEFSVTQALACAATPCGSTEKCCFENGAVKCRGTGEACRDDTGDSAGAEVKETDNRLALGLGIGIPLFVLFVISVVVLATKYRPGNRGSHKLLNINEQPGRSGMGSKSSFGSRRSSQVSPLEI